MTTMVITEKKNLYITHTNTQPNLNRQYALRGIYRMNQTPSSQQPCVESFDKGLKKERKNPTDRISFATEWTNQHSRFSGESDERKQRTKTTPIINADIWRYVRGHSLAWMKQGKSGRATASRDCF